MGFPHDREIIQCVWLYLVHSIVAELKQYVTFGVFFSLKKEKMGTNEFPKTEQGPNGDRVPKLIPMWLGGPPRLGNVDFDKINILQCEDIFLPAHTCRGWQRQLHSNSPTKTS